MPENLFQHFKPKYLSFLRLMVMRTTRIKWVWAATRTWEAGARRTRTTRRKAPGTRTGVMRSELRTFSSTVIVFCLHHTPLLLCQHPPLFVILLLPI